MVMGIGEAFDQFKRSNPDQQISKSKFYSLRPQNILPVSEMPHTVCVCVRHANFSFLVDAVSKSDPAFPKTHKDLLDAVCCQPDNPKCMNYECGKCITNLRVFLGSNVDLNTTVMWKEWKKIDNRPKLTENTTTLEIAISELQKQLDSFKTHSYVKKIQAKYFESCKKSLVETPTDAVMQVDFAENYAIVQQDEIQSAHWSHSQVTIFTCCVWHKKEVFSFAIISDDLKHSKMSVWVFLKTILEKLKQLAPKVNKVLVFSDNCAGQFKSRYNVSNVCYAENDFKVTLEWNFFASGHGKGAVDGLGGSVKRTVWREVQGRRALVTTPHDFYMLAAKKCKDICILFVPQPEVDSYEHFLSKRWNDLAEISGIQAMHHFQGYDQNNILVSKTAVALMQKIQITEEESSKNESEPHQLTYSNRLRYCDVYSSDEDGVEPLPTSSVSQNQIAPGRYILVKLISSKGKIYHYVAVCQSKVKPNEDVDVQFLKSCEQDKGKVFRTTDEEEKSVPFKDILKILEDPDLKLRGDRVMYQFSSPINVIEQ